MAEADADEVSLVDIIVFVCHANRYEHRATKLPAQVQSLLDAIRDSLLQMLSACLTKYVLDVYMPVRANMRPAPALVSPKKTSDSRSYRRMHPESAWTSMENALASAQSLSCVLAVRR